MKSWVSSAGFWHIRTALALRGMRRTNTKYSQCTLLVRVICLIQRLLTPYSDHYLAIYEWHFSFCAKLNSTVVFSSLPFYFWVLKQLPGCVTHSSNQSYEQLRELMMSEMPFFYAWFASVLAGVIQPMPEVGKSYQRLRGNLLIVNGLI